MAATLGSDVPFLVLGGTALGTRPGGAGQSGAGAGSRLALGGRVRRRWSGDAGRLSGAGSAARGWAGARTSAGSTDEILAALRQRDATVLAKSLVNDLEAAAVSLRPSIRHTLDAGTAAGSLAAIVSGSGPDVCVPLPRLRQRRVGRGGTQRQRHLPRRSHHHGPGSRCTPDLTGNAWAPRQSNVVISCACLPMSCQLAVALGKFVVVGFGWLAGEVRIGVVDGEDDVVIGAGDVDASVGGEPDGA